MFPTAEERERETQALVDAAQRLLNPERNNMTVRAKFLVESVNATRNCGTTITLQPVINGSEENKKFYRLTPGGKIELSTVNPEAAAQFTPGAAFYVDFTPTEA